ncbi:response regulator [bacterium]|nr:response regulator [bacterium]
MSKSAKKITSDNLSSLLGDDGYILILDPSESGRSLIKGFLEKLGITAFKVSSNTPEAKRLMLTTKFKLIICEWLMDDQNGIQFCREIRKLEQHQSTPFMLLSEENLRSDIVLASEVNIDRYLIKPFSFDAFMKQISGLCKQTLYPTDYQISVRSGNLSLLKLDFSNADAHFSRASELDPKAAKPLLGKAKVEIYRNNLDSAQILVDNTLKQNPDFVEAHRIQLKIYQLKENKDGVYKEAEYLNEISPDNPLYLLILAEKALEESNFAKAESCYKSVIMNSPKIALAHKGLGDISFAKEDFDKAEKHYKKAIGIEPRDLSALNQLGLTFVKKSLVQEGLQIYMTALKIDPTNPKILFNMGKAYEEIDMPKEAYNCYLNALNEAPNFKKASRAVVRLEKTLSITG